MKLVSFDGGFGRVEGDAVVPMGDDLAGYLRNGHAADGEPLALASVAMRAPIARLEKVICVGLNYRDHAAESGAAVPEEPVLFPKFANSVVGPGDEIVVPAATDQPDYEAELGVVIGRRAHLVDEADALDPLTSAVVPLPRIHEMVDRMLEAEAPWLPQFGSP